MKICYIRPVGPTLYERALKEIYKSKNKMAIKYFTIACCLMINVNLFASDVNNPLESLGYDAIDLVQFGLTIIAIIMALFEAGKALLEGDPKRIPSVFAKYGIGVICVYSIPGVYFSIKDAFQGWRR